MSGFAWPPGPSPRQPPHSPRQLRPASRNLSRRRALQSAPVMPGLRCQRDGRPEPRRCPFSRGCAGTRGASRTGRTRGAVASHPMTTSAMRARRCFRDHSARHTPHTVTAPPGRRLRRCGADACASSTAPGRLPRRLRLLPEADSWTGAFVSEAVVRRRRSSPSTRPNGFASHLSSCPATWTPPPIALATVQDQAPKRD